MWIIIIIFIYFFYFFIVAVVSFFLAEFIRVLKLLENPSIWGSYFPGKWWFLFESPRKLWFLHFVLEILKYVFSFKTDDFRRIFLKSSFPILQSPFEYFIWSQVTILSSHSSICLFIMCMRYVQPSFRKHSLPIWLGPAVVIRFIV